MPSATDPRPSNLTIRGPVRNLAVGMDFWIDMGVDDDCQCWYTVLGKDRESMTIWPHRCEACLAAKYTWLRDDPRENYTVNLSDVANVTCLSSWDYLVAALSSEL